jgi:hypothetical protein
VGCPTSRCLCEKACPDSVSFSCKGSFDLVFEVAQNSKALLMLSGSVDAKNTYVFMSSRFCPARLTRVLVNRLPIGNSAALLPLPDLVLIGKNVHSPVSVVKIIAQWRKMIGRLIFGVGVVVVLSPQHVLHLRVV